MSTKKVVIKKAEDKYSWIQTEESLTLSFPIKNVLLKHVDILYTDNFLKVNAANIKYFAIVDFPYSIDYENPRNRV
jgi:hypothetical protein